MMNIPNNDSILEIERLSQRVEIITKGGKQVWHVWNKSAHESTKDVRDTETKLILLHGGSGSWTHWLRNIRELSQKREVWALDIPGFGDSDLPQNAKDVDDLVPFVLEGLEYVGQGSGLDLVGFSFGGLLAGFIAAQSPAIINKLILVGVPGLGLTGKPLPLRGLRSDMVKSEISDVQRHNLKVMMLANEYMIDEATLELQQKNIKRDRLKRRRIARSDVLLELQKRWTAPVYAIWGELDALYLGRMDEIEGKFKSCDLRSFQTIAGAGHWVQYEQAKLFNSCLENILNN